MSRAVRTVPSPGMASRHRGGGGRARVRPGSLARVIDGAAGRSVRPDLPHPRPMTPGTPPPLPGSMTVPPLYGWENIVLLLVVLVVAAVAVGVLLSLGKAETGRSEWQAWLDGRSAGSPDRNGSREPSETG